MKECRNLWVEHLGTTRRPPSGPQVWQCGVEGCGQSFVVAYIFLDIRHSTITRRNQDSCPETSQLSCQAFQQQAISPPQFTKAENKTLTIALWSNKTLIDFSFLTKTIRCSDFLYRTMYCNTAIIVYVLNPLAVYNPSHVFHALLA